MFFAPGSWYYRVAFRDIGSSRIMRQKKMWEWKAGPDEKGSRPDSRCQ